MLAERCVAEWETIGDLRRADESGDVRVVCDAMCGGAARWLRMLGVDAAYTPGITDADLVALALRESRCVVSSDRRLFERRAFRTGELRGVRLRPGLRLMRQVRGICEALGIQPGPPRCTQCGGELALADRLEVGDRVPARSLVWATEFRQCRVCGRVFWRGTHWRRIDEVCRELRNAGSGGSRIPGESVE